MTISTSSKKIPKTLKTILMPTQGKISPLFFTTAAQEQAVQHVLRLLSASKNAPSIYKPHPFQLQTEEPPDKNGTVKPSVSDSLLQTCWYALFFADLVRKKREAFPQGLLPAQETVVPTNYEEFLKVSTSWNPYQRYLGETWYAFKEKCNQEKTMLKLWKKEKFRLHCIDLEKASALGPTDPRILEYFVALPREHEAQAFQYRYECYGNPKDFFLFQLSLYRTNPKRVEVEYRILFEECFEVWQEEALKRPPHHTGNQSGPSRELVEEAKHVIRLTQTAPDRTLASTYRSGSMTQSFETSDLLEKILIWRHDKKGSFRTNPHNSLMDLAKEVSSVPIFQESLSAKTRKILSERTLAIQLGRIFRKERASYQGWRIVKALTREELELLM